MNIIGRKKIEMEKASMFKFTLENESLKGFPLRTRELETKYGKTESLELMDFEGNKVFIILSAGLKNVDWDILTGKPIEIVYVGDKENEKTKQVFKNFEVYELELEG